MKTVNNTLKKITALTIALLLVITAFAGCGSTGESEDGVQKIAVGAPISAGQFAYMNEDGELDGYEIAVLKAVDERLPQYEFDIQGSDFNNILLSLDTGKIDLGAFLFEYSEDRAANYAYGGVGYANFSTYLVFPADAEDTSLAALSGKVLGSFGNANNVTNHIDAYFTEHPELTPVEYDLFGEATDEVKLQSLLEGRWDAIYGVYWLADQWNETYGNGQKIVQRGDLIDDSLAYYLYPKDDQHTELRTAVDGALQELIDDGTLLEISQKFFGFDITPTSLGK